MALVDKKSLYDLVPGEGAVSQMDSLTGPQFANPEQYSPSLHEDSLTGLYNSSVHNLNYGPMSLDKDGLSGPQFANQEQYSPSLHEDALAGIYNSSVHNLQYAMTLYDLDGIAPSNQYLSNLPEGLGALIG